MASRVPLGWKPEQGCPQCPEISYRYPPGKHKRVQIIQRFPLTVASYPGSSAAHWLICYRCGWKRQTFAHKASGQRPGANPIFTHAEIIEMTEMYCDLRMSAREIAEVFSNRYNVKVWHTVVQDYLRRAGVRIRKKGGSKPGRRVPDHQTMELIRHYYYDEELSLEEVGKKIGCCGSTVALNMKLCGLPIRTRAESTKICRRRRQASREQVAA